MGGKEGSRGYLYQGMASVFEALTQDHWDKIYLEFQTEHDKVDIALEVSGTIKTAIQVKSTINTFSDASLKEWLSAIQKDYACSEYCLFLIGQCKDAAIDFKNAIEKYQQGCIDEKTKKSLQTFDCSIFENAQIAIKILPVDSGTLCAILCDSLSRYLENQGYLMTHDRIDFIISAIIADQMFLSTKGGFVERKDFDKTLTERIKMLSDHYVPQRIPLRIQSFDSAMDRDNTGIQNVLNFSDKFDGRSLRKEFEWKKDIYDPLDLFLKTNIDNDHAYKLYLDAHMSIAFSAGRILNTKEGKNAFPIQKTFEGEKDWTVNPTDLYDYCKLGFEYVQRSSEMVDSALILNITHDIFQQVQEYVNESGLKIGKIINCTLENDSSTNFSIINGAHAARLANSVYNALARRDTPERRATLHIFASAPNAFMFFLGQVSMGFGKMTVYEYDFEQRNSCTYEPAISF